jgi:hypothetical protein
LEKVPSKYPIGMKWGSFRGAVHEPTGHQPPLWPRRPRKLQTFGAVDKAARTPSERVSKYVNGGEEFDYWLPPAAMSAMFSRRPAATAEKFTETRKADGSTGAANDEKEIPGLRRLCW